MKIDGRNLADTILTRLLPDVAALMEKGVVPTLAVIFVGEDPASVSFIRQKRLAAEKIGAELILSHQSSAISSQQLADIIKRYNDDPNIHGLIIQRPLPVESTVDRSILLTVSPQKDVDGFVPGSLFDAPVAMAVVRICEEIFGKLDQLDPFDKKIVLVGRGETAGTPIARLLTKKRIPFTVIHSQTAGPKEIMKQADIIISCVGKPRVVTKDAIAPGTILIGVGMHREEDGTLHGDYEEEVEAVASFYTPTPGGVGPVNVACLMQNLISACIMRTGGLS